MEPKTIPFAIAILRKFCPNHLLEEIEGDLLQKFERDAKIFGEKKAKRRLRWNVIRYLRPGIIMRNKFSFELNQLYMIKSYFKVLVRSMARRKFYAAINIACLTIGITFTLLIGLFIFNELRVNQRLSGVEKLFLVEGKAKSTGDVTIFTPGILPKQALDQYPSSFENYYRFWDRNITISKNEKHVRLQSMIGDPSFLDIFGFRVLYGDRASAWKNPNAIVITKKTALQFFSNADAVGEMLTLSTEQNGKREYLVTAVIDDPEDKNSVTDFMNMDAQVFLSLENATDFFPQANPDTWQNEIITYIKLKSTDASDAQAMLNKIVVHSGPQNFSDAKTIALNPISDYYQSTNHGAVQKMIGSLFVIVIFILILAISNFINLSIANSFARFKEVGIRKVVGGLQKQVVIQFLLESLTLSFFSGIVALLLYQIVHPYFSSLLDSTLPSLTQFTPTLWLAVIAGVFAIGLLAGIYPAVFQSLAKPIDSLKGKVRSVKGPVGISRALIGVQFLITTIIFISAVIVSRQSDYFINKDLGYNKSHVLIVSSVPRLWTEDGFQKMESAKKEFLQSPKVESVSLSWGAPGWNFSPGGSKVFKSGSSADKGIDHVITAADEDFEKVFGLKITEGNFLTERGTQQPFGVVINQAAQKALHAKVGDQLNASGYGDTLFTVKGVVQDFNFDSLHEKVGPLMIMSTRDFQAYRYFSFRLTPGKPSESIREVEKLWKATFPEEALNYSFADERLKALYTTELQMQKASTMATGLMLAIVVIGVVGLVSLSVSKRIKEIGIRKVMGASVSNILLLITREYIGLLAVSFLIAVPLTYVFASGWLNNFAYHIELAWWMFVLPALTLFSVVIAIVSTQSLTAATSNPVETLKYE
jgi:putative ABC transport system permease protein